MFYKLCLQACSRLAVTFVRLAMWSHLIRRTEGNPFVPMEVIASVTNDDEIPRLGLTSWWEGVGEPEVDEEP